MRREAEAGTEGSVRHRPLPHLPGLDGIRGAAVLAVLLFHAGFRWARGGYLGVTTFFVLSGFLITSLLLGERDRTGSIDLGAFWRRRARRLAPALAVLVGLVVVYVAFTSTQRHPGIVGDAVAALTWVANWRFVFAHRSYADLFAQPSPFQHVWSLGVEEQFYLVLPLLAVVLLRRGRRWPLATAAAAGVVLSTLTAALIHHPGGPAGGHAYYGTDARAAEPLIGVLLALVLIGRNGLRSFTARGRIVVDLVGVVGLATLGFFVATLAERSDGLYRGGFLAAAVASAAVVAASTQPGSVVARLFAVEPLAWLGRISYGVYLVHWPVFLWLSPPRLHLPVVQLFAVRCALTIALATASYLAIEQPVRLGRIPFTWAAVGWVNASIGLLAGLVALTSSVPGAADVLLGTGQAAAAPVASAAQPAPTRPNASVAAATDRPSRPGTVVMPGRLSASAPQPPSTATPAGRAVGAGVARLESPPGGPAPPPPTRATDPNALRVAVIGDSMAYDLAGGLTDWANARGDVIVYNLATPGCPLSRGGTRRLADGTNWPVADSCQWWADPNSGRSTQLAQFDPQLIVVQDGMNEVPDRKLPSWATYRRPGQPQFDSWLLDEYTAALRTVTSKGAKVLFLNTVCADWDLLGGPFAGYAANSDGDTRVASLDRTDQAIVVTGVQAGDLQGHLCPNGRFTQTVDGVNNAREDGYHLSKQASDAVADRWLGPLVLSQMGPHMSPPAQKIG